MKNVKLISLLLLFFTYFASAQYVKVDQDKYTIEQLIKDVLIKGACAEVKNITSSTGTKYNSENGIGYFAEPSGEFPIKEGIILSTGNAKKADGPEQTGQSEGDIKWIGDDDLKSVFPEKKASFLNASIIEFDFRTVKDAISFSYLLASEEYGTFQCSFTDAFAFILTNTATNTTENVALIPETTIPVAVTTIKDGKYNKKCPSENVEYFGRYFGDAVAVGGDNGEPKDKSPTNFLGYTKKIKAKATIEPNTWYHMKFVIADYQDTAKDSAVFLEGGSFDLGGGLGDDITVNAGTAVCLGKSQTITTGEAPDVKHIWYKDGTEIPNETSPSLTVTEPGTYSVKIDFGSNCFAEDSVLIEFKTPGVVKALKNVTSCTNTFDLTVNTPLALGNQPTDKYAVRYFKTKAEAEAGTPEIKTPNNYTGTNGEEIFVRVDNISDNECFGTDAFKLKIDKPDASFSMKPDCDSASVDSTPQATGGTYTLNPDLGDGALIDATTGTITNGVPGATYNVKYTVTGDCPAEATFNIKIADDLDIKIPTPLETCDNIEPIDGFANFTLTDKDAEIINGNTTYKVTYHKTQNDANTGANPLATPYKNETKDEQIIFAYIIDTASGCDATTPLTLKVSPSPDVAFKMQSTCFQSALVSETPKTAGGVFSFEPQPNDNAKINATSGEITEATFGATYTVKYAISEDCPAEHLTEITILDDLKINTPSPLKVCDDSPFDGFSNFTLTDKNDEITIANPNYTITYHKTEDDAKNNTSPIGNTYKNETIYKQTIYALVKNTVTACQKITPLDIEVIKVNIPVFEMEPSCGGAIVTSKSPDGGTFSFETPPSDTAEINPTSGEITNGTLGSTYTVKYTLIGDCEAIATQSVTVLDAPAIVMPKNDLISCDDQNDTDGSAVFDLTTVTNEITNNDNSITLAFFETKAQAQAGNDAITNPKAYSSKPSGINNAQTIYVSASNATGCPAFTSFTIRVIPNPSPGEPITLKECDNDLDQIAVFDLTLNENYIVNGETDVALSYYNSIDDANAKTNAITEPKQFKNKTNPQTVFVRIDNTGDSEEAKLGCFAITQFEVKVVPKPDFDVTVEDMSVCDDDTDEKFPFNLEQQTEDILKNTDAKTNFKVTYHASKEDADNDENPLASLFINDSNPQTIFVRIETNDALECANTEHTFNLIVNPIPDINSDKDPLVLENCDDTIEFDGNTTNDSTTFDIESTTAEVLDNLDPKDYKVSYYTSKSDADTATNPITNTSKFTNTTNPQLIYVRVDNINNSLTECYATTTLTLKVNPLPPLDIKDTYLICGDTNGTQVSDEVAIIETFLDENTYTFKWVAQSSNTIIGTASSLETKQVDVYTVTATNVLTGCQSSATTTVILSTPPKVFAEVIGIEFSDNQSIKVTTSSSGTASLFEFSLDDGPWVNNTPNNNAYTFKNVAPGIHNIKVRDINGCGITETSVVVLGYPPFFTPNNDGYHDTWQIYGIENFPGTKIHIFDRYGKLLKQISPMGDGWDGNFNGKKLPSTDYWFTVEYIDKQSNNPKQFKGHFALKR